MTINKIREELFGRLKEPKKTRATGDHKVDIEIIKYLWTPIEGDETIMYFFCSGCGNIVSVTPRFAKVLAREAGGKIPREPKKYYFRSGRCGECDSQNNSIELLPIPQMNA